MNFGTRFADAIRLTHRTRLVRLASVILSTGPLAGELTGNRLAHDFALDVGCVRGAIGRLLVGLQICRYARSVIVRNIAGNYP